MSTSHNLAWLATNFPCRAACPVGTNAGGYASLIGAGHTEEAYALARRPNPLASVCGLICAHPCESACRRSALDSPLSIRALKRYANERFGVESQRSFDEILEVVERPRAPAETPGRVAVIGAGPAGLACAHDLRLMGHEVVIFDGAQVAGGMLRLGIPDYRLPPAILDREVDFVRFLGADLRLGTEVGPQLPFAQLREDFDAVFVATGCRKGRGLPIAGTDNPRVLTAVDFLANVNLGVPLDIGDRVLVIGGGNVAFDAARSARRMDLGDEGSSPPPGAAELAEDGLPVPHLNLALDAARHAAFSMKKQVTLTCLEDRHQLPADDVELEEAMEEGIDIHFRRAPQEVLHEDGQVRGLRVKEVASLFDAEGRFSPQLVEGSDVELECDTVIVAIGQVADLSFLGEDHGLDIGPRSTVIVNASTLATSAEGIFAGGDVAFGPRIAISAVADGRRAAKGIDTFLTGRQDGPPQVVVKQFQTFGYDHPFATGDYEKITRRRIPVREVLDRESGQQVEVGYDAAEAAAEGARCLRCWVNTVFDSDQMKASQCIQCGGCVDVCPEACIDLVHLNRVAESGQGAPRFLLPDASSTGTFSDEGGAAMLKNEERCIRCGLCARRCPTACVTMQAFYLAEERELVELAERQI